MKRRWHAEFGRGPWGRGWLGLRPDVRPNVGGGRSFGWWQFHVWWTQSDGSDG